MAATNPITGDDLVSKANTKDYEEGYERIFGVKKKEKYVPPPLPDGILGHDIRIDQILPTKVEPDAYCVTTADGGCISDDPRCMHQIK